MNLSDVTLDCPPRRLPALRAAHASQQKTRSTRPSLVGALHIQGILAEELHLVADRHLFPSLPSSSSRRVRALGGLSRHACAGISPFSPASPPDACAGRSLFSLYSQHVRAVRSPSSSLRLPWVAGAHRAPDPQSHRRPARTPPSALLHLDRGEGEVVCCHSHTCPGFPRVHGLWSTHPFAGQRP
jgi:hypothetical protein